MSEATGCTNREEVRAHYGANVEDLRERMNRLHARQMFVVGLTLLLVSIAVTAGVQMIRGYPALVFLSSAAAMSAAGSTAWLVRTRSAIYKTGRRLEYYERGLQRLACAWKGKTDGGLAYKRTGHLYQDDLGVLGEGSLFELLHTTRTGAGAGRLADYLLEIPDLAEIHERQAAVRELRDALALREQVALLGKYPCIDCREEQVRAWLRLPPFSMRGILALTLRISGGLSFALVTCGYAGIFGWNQLLVVLSGCISIQMAIAVAHFREVHARLGIMTGITGDMAVLREGIALLSTQQFASSKLRRIVRQAGDAQALLRKLELVFRMADRRQHPIVYGFSLWFAAGTQAVVSAERWRTAYLQEIEESLQAWAGLDALCALANYAFEHPEDAFPVVRKGGLRLEIRDMRHPLMAADACVGNDVRLDEKTACYVISGSNMAGKSTFLRAIGLNAVLAFAGAPVAGSYAHLGVCPIMASIGVVDSLHESKSRFFAEVEKLRATVRETAEGKPVLFLMDELLAGTNARDRRVAAEAVLRALVRAGAIGAISTHDLAITELAQMGELRAVNLHMQSPDRGDPLAFDYRLKPGVVTQSNALALMRMMGLATAPE